MPETSGPLVNRKVPPGFRYLRATSVLQLGRFELAQKLLTTRESIFHPENLAPPLVLFISHRWEKRTDPDPTARQLKAIQHVLRSIPEVASLMEVPAGERLRRLPSLRKHGILHAALLLGSADTDDGEDNVWKDWARVVKSKSATELLDFVGIWYDYSCMPQATSGSANTGRGKLFENLTKLPDLVRSSPVLILREKGDDYSGRGWCAAEVAAARKDNQHIVLRMDLLGKSIKDSDLAAADKLSAQGSYGSAFESAAIFRGALDRWESKQDERPSLWGLYIGLPDIKQREETRTDLLLTTHRNPNAFPQQKALLMHFIKTLQALSEADVRDGALKRRFDLAVAVQSIMGTVGLKCTENWDVVFVGLSIMRSRHHPALVPTVEQLYRVAIERWVKGESLELVRFRERRDGMSWEVWYLFEGEAPNVRTNRLLKNGRSQHL